MFAIDSEKLKTAVLMVFLADVAQKNLNTALEELAKADPYNPIINKDIKYEDNKDVH